jgi:hypothetical protein
MSEGASFISINPSTLDDSSVWSYADLRSLCKAVKLKGNGKRDELVQRLQSWHKLRLTKGVAGLAALQGSESPSEMKKWLSMNVEGSNFALLSQNVVARANSPQFNNSNNDNNDNNYGAGGAKRSGGKRGAKKSASDTQNLSPNCSAAAASPARASRRQSVDGGYCGSNKLQYQHTQQQPSSAQKRRTSLLNGVDLSNSHETLAVSPTLLKPLHMLPGESKGLDVTPGKSILKRNTEREREEHGSASKITFSPFNGTKVIPHRRAPQATGKSFWQDEDDDVIMEEEEEFEDDPEELKGLDENYVDAEAARNAEQNTMLAEDDDESSDGSTNQELWERAF